ncbi:ECF transporter S component [Marvinbryantia formatexigens]|nr:ECF transporter S component [Marvinbryantia formatexigens]UWO24022.1 ECF transporter S component [Marvinbryantia formatexigens DSM 14469]SDG66312.1 Riboflavin transporter FmnP [Marvinbryantia formatexigens]
MSSNTNVAAASAAKSNIRNMVVIAMLGAVAMILQLFEFPLWFAPSFYEIDLSEVPVMIGTFALGPVAGALIELVKNLLKLVIKGTSTAFVGDIANFIIGCALVVPAGIIYKRKKSRKNAIIGMAVGTLFMTVAGCFINAYVLLPAYSQAFGMPIDALIEMGTAVNPAITGLGTFVVLAVAPFNIIKGVLVSVITLLLYKYISPVLKGQTM